MHRTVLRWFKLKTCRFCLDVLPRPFLTEAKLNFLLVLFATNRWETWFKNLPEYLERNLRRIFEYVFGVIHTELLKMSQIVPQTEPKNEQLSGLSKSNMDELMVSFGLRSKGWENIEHKPRPSINWASLKLADKEGRRKSKSNLRDILFSKSTF